MIEVSGLTKKYGSLIAIENITFRVRSGEIVGLLGPNGAGKTTTLRIITGYLPPTAGTAKIDGIDISQKPEKAKEKIGYLPENAPLYPELTVEEYLRFVAGIRHLSDVDGRVIAILKRTGTEIVRKRLIGNISKGYRQRVAIAQALIHDPDLLILDEPTVGLDPKQILEVRGLLKMLGGGRQAVIFSSHILQEVSALCERVIIIHRGKIVADQSISGATDLEALFLKLTEEEAADVVST
ncbi:MAG: ATP-binding cassette domain-containing protein [Deltaproteobacteria bacterium]|nr:ATP-binding cassette domain-containing protein [Deltaproteobacteria bacterium]